MFRSFHKVVVLTAAVLLMPGCSFTPDYQQALDMTVEDYRNKVKKDNAGAGHIIVFSSEDAVQNNPGTADSERDDNYVRAEVDRRTGATSYQIINLIHYQGEDWNHYQTVKYLTQEGVIEDKLIVVKREVTDCSVFSGGNYIEIVGFNLSEEIVKNGAQRYKPGDKTGLKYKFFAKNGEGYKGILFAQELVAVYSLVEEYKKNQTIGSLSGTYGF